MSDYLIQGETLTAIGDAIRAKTGNTAQLTPAQMATEIAGIQTSSGDDGSFKAVIEGTAVNPTLPSDLTKIGDYVFGGCPNLSFTSLPAGITSIGNSAFRGCANLALASLPAGVTSIGPGAFFGCTNLVLTSLPAGITSIDNLAFAQCTGLTTITFKGTPQSISSNAFIYCTNLTTINVPWAEGAISGAPWNATNATINYNYTEEA